MGLFDKFKNIFTEEVEEEQEVKKVVRQVEIVAPQELEEKQEEPAKEEKFVFPVYFDEKDFDDLAPKKETEKKENKKEIYNFKNKTQTKIEDAKKFKPSPIISPVYGILDKNYKKDDVFDKGTMRSEYYKPRRSSLEDVRKKAFGTLEEELETSLFKDDPIYTEKEETTDLFLELESESNFDDPINILEDRIVDDYKNTTDSLEVLTEEDNMTLEELNKLDNKEDELKITESDLFNLIDSMYEESDNNGDI